MSTYKQNGEYELTTLEIEFSDGDILDIRDIFMDITLYESLIDPSMSGSVSVVDSTGMFNTYSLGHGETVRVRFNTSGMDTEIRYEGYVYKAAPPTNVSEHAYGTVLYFVSKEFINNKRKIITRAFNSEISNIVSRTFEEVREKKSIDIEPTMHIHHIVTPTLHPFDFIPKLARRAKSVTGRYGYVFYESNLNWNFKPLQSLYRQEPISLYKYRKGGFYQDVDKKEEEQFNAIQNYEITDVDNIINQINDGLMGATATNLAMLEKRVIEQTYKENEQFNSRTSTGKYPSQKSGIYGDGYDGRREIFVTDTEQPYLESRFFNLMETMKTQKYAAVIEVFGNSNNHVGSVIDCELPVWSSSTNTPSNSPPDPYSGPCLVYEIKHTLKKTGYMQTIKLVRDAYMEQTS